VKLPCPVCHPCTTSSLETDVGLVGHALSNCIRTLVLINLKRPCLALQNTLHSVNWASSLEKCLHHNAINKRATSGRSHRPHIGFTSSSQPTCSAAKLTEQFQLNRPTNHHEPVQRHYLAWNPNEQWHRSRHQRLRAPGRLGAEPDRRRGLERARVEPHKLHLQQQRRRRLLHRRLRRAAKLHDPRSGGHARRIQPPGLGQPVLLRHLAGRRLQPAGCDPRRAIRQRVQPPAREPDEPGVRRLGERRGASILRPRRSAPGALPQHQRQLAGLARHARLARRPARLVPVRPAGQPGAQRSGQGPLPVPGGRQRAPPALQPVRVGVRALGRRPPVLRREARLGRDLRPQLLQRAREGRVSGCVLVCVR